MDLFTLSSDDAEAFTSGAENSPGVHGGSVAEDQLFVALCKDAVTGSDGPRTMCFIGSIQNHQLLILVDSGSSHSFLSSHIAAQLTGFSLSLSQSM